MSDSNVSDNSTTYSCEEYFYEDEPSYGNVSPDCLVLHLFEKDENYVENIDIETFIIYDPDMDKFAVIGRRHEPKNPTRQFVCNPYYFYCENEHELFRFLSAITDRCDNNNDNDSKYGMKYVNISFTLYNYTNLPLSTKDIEFSMLKINSRPYKEIIGFDNVNLRTIKQYIKVLRSVRNV